MSEAKHTPGPWQAISSDPAEGVECFWIKAQPHPGLRGFTREIASSSGARTDEEIANARLIAAAPELLAVAKMFQSFAKGGGHFSYPLGSLQALETAIAKAEGTPLPSAPKE